MNIETSRRPHAIRALAIVGVALSACAASWRSQRVSGGGVEIAIDSAADAHGAGFEVHARVLNRGAAPVTLHPERVMISLPNGHDVRAVVPAVPRVIVVAPLREETMALEFAMSSGEPSWHEFPYLQLDWGDAITVDEHSIGAPSVRLEHP